MDTKHINLLNLIPTKTKRVASTNGGEYHGACPFCGGSDRFVIQPNADSPRWYCRQCQRKGDAIAFVMEYESLDFKAACERLRLESYQPAARRFAAPARNDKPAPKQAEASWMDKAAVFSAWAHEQLLKNPAKLDYLIETRGFSLTTIKRYQLGYCPQEFNRVWGQTKVYLPAGIVIPWLDAEGKPRRLRFRLDNATAKRKYTQAAGGENYLYNAHSIHRQAAVLLVEGELDALAAMEGFKHTNFVAVATGGTTGARRISWQALLAVSHTVLVAFDADEPGNNAAKYWLDNLNNAKRLVPLAHDVNDMLIKNLSIKDWVFKVFSDSH